MGTKLLPPTHAPGCLRAPNTLLRCAAVGCGYPIYDVTGCSGRRRKNKIVDLPTRRRKGFAREERKRKTLSPSLPPSPFFVGRCARTRCGRALEMRTLVRS